MTTKAFLLAAAFATASLAGTALAQPAPDQPPPPADSGPPPGYNGAPPPPPGGSMMGPAGHVRHGLRERFATANVTGDGRLTMQQAQAGGMPGVAAHFGEIDRDNKGYVTLQDIHMWYAARHGAPAGGMQGPPPGDRPPPPGQPQ